MRRIIVVTALSLMLVMSMASAAFAGNGYGKAVQDCFGATYGHAKNAAWESGHATKPALGAKLTAVAHGCV